MLKWNIGVKMFSKCNRNVIACDEIQTYILFLPNLLQLCYSHILKGDDGDFKLLFNNKVQGGSGGCFFFIRGVKKKKKPHSHLVLYYRDLVRNKMGTLIYHVHLY
jgi:hypothetical protein